MYGTIASGRVKKDRLRDLMALGKEWDAKERRRAVGYLSSEMLWSDAQDGRFMFVVRFLNKERYVANAASPEQDAFYQKLRECLDADPVWFDGEFGRWDDTYAKPPTLA